MFFEVSKLAAKAARRGRRGRDRTTNSLRLRSARRGGVGLFGRCCGTPGARRGGAKKAVCRLGEPSRNKKQHEERGFYPMSGERLMHDLTPIGPRRYEADVCRKRVDVNFVCKRVGSH